MREFFRSVDSLHRELQQCKDCLCYCCAVGHRQADGRRMACDRRVINSCITLWFGSVENFDSAVRSEVLACLTEQLVVRFNKGAGCDVQSSLGFRVYGSGFRVRG